MWKYSTLNSKCFQYADLNVYLSQPFTDGKNIIVIWAEQCMWLRHVLHIHVKRNAKTETALYMTRIVLLLTSKVKLTIVIKLHTILMPQKEAPWMNPLNISLRLLCFPLLYVYIFFQWSNHSANTKLVVITFISKHFELDGIGQTGQE